MLNKSKLYSYTLVLSQFTCITLLISFNKDMFYKSVPLLFFLSGIAFFIYIIFHNRISNFNIIPDIKKDAILVTTGAYKYIRHPMYTAVLITAFAPLSNNLSLLNMFIGTILAITLILKAKKEELLWTNLLPEYIQYKKRTKMIVPFLI